MKTFLDTLHMTKTFLEKELGYATVSALDIRITPFHIEISWLTTEDFDSRSKMGSICFADPACLAPTFHSFVASELATFPSRKDRELRHLTKLTAELVEAGKDMESTAALAFAAAFAEQLAELRTCLPSS